MDSIFRRFVRHHPRVSVALVAGAAFALALALRRTMTAGPRAAPSAAHLLRLINAANARLSGKIFPMGQGAETVVVRDGGIAVRCCRPSRTTISF